MDLNAVLLASVSRGASDIHLKIDQPPVVRRDGSLEPLAGWPALSERDLGAMLDAVTAAHPARRRQFDESGDLDLSYQGEGLPRFRVNGFRQRGAISFAFR